MHYVIPWQPNIQLKKKNALEIDCLIKYIENYIIVVEIHFDAYRKKTYINTGYMPFPM